MEFRQIQLHLVRWHTQLNQLNELDGEGRNHCQVSSLGTLTPVELSENPVGTIRRDTFDLEQVLASDPFQVLG